MSTFALARANMVEGLIRPNHVSDPALLVALHSVPRELFVPKGAAGFAYVDDEIVLGNGRRLPEPLVLSRLLQEAEITPRDAVLDVGCATGYSTAILAQLAGSVVAVESDPELRKHAQEALAAVGVQVPVVDAAFAAGYPAKAPYDVIVLNGEVAVVPDAILQQLADGGRLVTVVAGRHPISRLGEARLYRRIGNTFPSVSLFETYAPSLPGFAAKPSFVF